NANQHRRTAYQQSVIDQRAERFAAQLAQNSRKLQTDRDENETIEDEYDHSPNGVSWKPKPRAQDDRSMPPEVNSGSDDRQNSRNMEALRQQIRGQWRQQRNRDLDRRIIEVSMHPARDKSD